MITIGTRGSELALWQANYTKNLLEKEGHEVQIKIIETKGDATQQWNTSFDKLEGKGFFTKELEDALLNKTIDVAVHSHKDLPTENPDGLIVAGVSSRENPADWLIMKDEAEDSTQKFNLKQGAKVGTSSARRKSQLLAFRPDVEISDLRGNVPTRIQKLRDGQFDAIILAAAGLERLEIDLSEFTVEQLDPSEFIPAPAQGVLAWQIREDDYKLSDVFDAICNYDVMININIERRILNLLDGGCQLPLGAYCDVDMNEHDRKLFKVSVAIADAWNTQPKQLYYETTNTEDLPEKIVEHIHRITPKNVFISRDENESGNLNKWLKNLGFNVENKSLIELKKLTLKELPKSDWLFFSSKHAVEFFFMQNPNIGTTKIGCMGKGTSQVLREFGKRADFIGTSTDTKLVGKQFAARVGLGKVVFPIARDSMRTIQWQFAKQDNVIDLPIYASLKVPHIVAENTDILVFTSPSNVESYLEKNKITPNQKIIAMGESTEKTLIVKGKIKDTQIHKPYSFDDLGLYRAVLNVI
jgi:hydroxymethylbilane synthase